MDILHVLNQVGVFSAVDEPALTRAAAQAQVLHVPRGELVFRQDEHPAGFYILAEGSLRMFRATRDGREQVLHTAIPCQAWGDIALFEGSTLAISARAREDSRIVLLPRDTFEWLWRTHPEVAPAIVRQAGRRLRRMIELVERFTTKDVHARVAAGLLDYAAAAGAEVDGGSFVLPCTQGEFAAELATTRESVARALSRFRREGIVQQSGRRLRIRKVARLRAAAGPSGELAALA
jgi:CRP-like cAMP-binding protein